MATDLSFSMGLVSGPFETGMMKVRQAWEQAQEEARKFQQTIGLLDKAQAQTAKSTGEVSKAVEKEQKSAEKANKTLDETKKKAEEGNKQWKETIETVKHVAEAFALFEGVKTLVEGVMGQIEQGRALTVLSSQTGESVKSLVGLQRSFQELGVSSDLVGDSIFKLQKSLGGINDEGQPTDKVFQQLGLNVAQLKTEDAVTQFDQITKALQKLPDQASRSAAGMQIFGRSAMQLNAILADPRGFDEAIEKASPIAAIMDKNAEAFKKVSLLMEEISNKTQDLFAGIASGLTPALTQVLEVMNQINLIDVGNAIGRSVLIITEAFKEGKISELLYLSLEIGGKMFANALYGLLAGAISAAGTYLDEWPKLMQAEFQVFQTANFWLGIVEVAISAFASLGAYIMKTFIDVAVYFGAAIEKEIRDVISLLPTSLRGGITNDKTFAQITADDQRAAEPLYASADQALSNLQGSGNDGLNRITGASAPLVSQVLDSGKKIADSAISALAKSKLFDSNGDIAKLNGITKQINDHIKSATEIQKTPAANNGGAASTSVAAAKYDGDRLAKVGLFVGGNRPNATLTEAQKIRASTDKMLKVVEKMAKNPPGKLPMGGTFAP